MGNNTHDDDDKLTIDLYQKLQRFVIYTAEKDERFQDTYIIMGAVYSLLSSLISFGTEGMARNSAIKRLIFCLEELEDDSSPEELHHIVTRRLESLAKICDKHPNTSDMVKITKIEDSKKGTIH